MTEAPVPTELESTRHSIDPLALEHLQNTSRKENAQATEAAAHSTAERDEADEAAAWGEAPVPGKEYILLQN